MSIQEISYTPEFIPSSYYEDTDPLPLQIIKGLQSNSSTQARTLFGYVPFALIPAILICGVVTSDLQMVPKETPPEFTNNKINFDNYEDLENDYNDHEMFKFITFLDNQIDAHPELVVHADENQLARIMKLVAGVKVD